MGIVIICFLVFISAVCSALMDVGNFHPSQFRLPNWWKHNWTAKYIDGDPGKGRVKWRLFGIAINKPVQLSDGWHFSKMVFIVTNILSIVIAMMEGKGLNFIEGSLAVLGLGILWNISFSLFYNKIFRSK